MQNMHPHQIGRIQINQLLSMRFLRPAMVDFLGTGDSVMVDSVMVDVPEMEVFVAVHRAKGFKDLAMEFHVSLLAKDHANVRVRGVIPTRANLKKNVNAKI